MGSDFALNQVSIFISDSSEFVHNHLPLIKHHAFTYLLPLTLLYSLSVLDALLKLLYLLQVSPAHSDWFKDHLCGQFSTVLPHIVKNSAFKATSTLCTGPATTSHWVKLMTKQWYDITMVGLFRAAGDTRHFRQLLAHH